MAWITNLLPWGFQPTGDGGKESEVGLIPAYPFETRPRTWSFPAAPRRPLLFPRGHWPSPVSVSPARILMADFFRPRLQSLTGSVLSHRVFFYTFASTLAVSATVINALQNHSNFYSVAVYLSKSGASVLVTSSCVRLVHSRSNSPLLPRSSPISACSWL